MKVIEPTVECLEYCRNNDRPLYKSEDGTFYISFPSIRDAVSHRDEVAMLTKDVDGRFFGFEVFVTCDAVVRTTRQLERLL